MELTAVFIGFGNVARAFARMLNGGQEALRLQCGLNLQTKGIATAKHGCIISANGIDLVEAAKCVEAGGQLTQLSGSVLASNPFDVIDNCSADILFETTPLSPFDGEPAIAHIRRALSQGTHVVTANKGPIAFAYSELKSLADRRALNLRFEGTVMDGTPVFNLVERCLPGARMLSFSGVLNSTTNLILTSMESGFSFDEALAEARQLGIAETKADYDIDGWDSAVKATALANVLFNADLRPSDVDRQGIRGITIKDVEKATSNSQVLRLTARGVRSDSGVSLKVALESVLRDSALGSVRGTSNVLVMKTDLMGEIAMVEYDPGVNQTAYALLSDLLTVHQNIARNQRS
jgi:homoserine dehydrogenase